MKRAEATGSCPQCGGQVDLNIGDPLLSCSFCRTKLYMVPPSGIFSYFLSPIDRAQDDAHLCHLPYWRFRGFKFRVHEHQASDSSLVDVTIPASDMISNLPPLGVAPQIGTMKLNPLSPPGLRYLIDPKKALETADANIEAVLKSKPIMEGIMAENASIIHAPFEIVYIKGKASHLRPLWGAKGHIRLNKTHKEAVSIFMEPVSKKRRIRFIPLICPKCGGDLPAYPRATALLCRFCNMIWPIGDASAFPKRFVTVEAPAGRDDIFLPFWDFSLYLQNTSLENRYAFYKQLFPYKEFPKEWKKRPVQILVPAFKINPSLFFRLSTRMSRLETNFMLHENKNPGEIPRLHPVNFTLNEAAYSIRIVLFDLFRNKKRVFDQIRKAAIRIKGSRLLLLPFMRKNREYVEFHSGQALPVPAIEFGTRL